MKTAILWLSLVALAVVPAAAEFPYPNNPQPCGTDASDDCVEATDFGAYLFLPVADPPVLPNDFGNDNWKLTSERTGDPAIDQLLEGVRAHCG